MRLMYEKKKQLAFNFWYCVL